MESYNTNHVVIPESCILYALGELSPEAMADLDLQAFSDPALERELEWLLNLVGALEESPEMAKILADKSLFAAFLRYLASFGQLLWPWRQLSNMNWSTVEAAFKQWRTEESRKARAPLFRKRLLSPKRFPEELISEDCCELGAVRDVARDCAPELRMLSMAPSDDLCCESFCRNLGAPDMLEEIPYEEEINSPDGFTAKEANVFLNTSDNPFATFGLDVDTASFTLCKTYLNEHDALPPPESVREEEYINSFDWDLPEPSIDDPCPFKPTVEIGAHPLKPELLLARIGIQGKLVPEEKVPPMNLTYLIDVSGSMYNRNKLPLIKESLIRLLERLRPCDYLAIVTYSNSSVVELESTSCSRKARMVSAIEKLEANGGTNGGDGLKLAYEQARKNFITGGINRIILCSDGDFNVGMSDKTELTRFIKKEAKSGVFLTVLGFGMGNYKDNLMELLANHGQGNYSYINNQAEAQRVLVDEFFSTMITIAKDVKIQIDFNPANIQSWRLIGYESRVMEAKDFNNDEKESGNIGSGQNVVALLELVPVGVKNSLEPHADQSRYARKKKKLAAEDKSNLEMDPEMNNDLFLVKIRWKEPDETASRYQDFPIAKPTERQLADVSPKYYFTYAVALFAQILADSPYIANADMSTVWNLALGSPQTKQRKEFLNLVKKASEFLE